MNVSAEEIKKWETPSGISSDDIEQLCDERCSEYIGSSVAGCAIAIVKDGEVVFEKGYGYADVKNKVLVDPKTTVFEYGSVSKLFTWTSAMQLVQSGKIDLNRDIREYLPNDFKLETKYSKPITMLDLMNHQAGYDDYIIHLFCKENEIPDLKTALYENKVAQIHEPGYAMSYSNYSAGLAGYIIECISGEPMYQYVQKNIFDVAGMEHATLNPDISDNKYIQENKSKGYVVDNKGNFEDAGWSYVPMYPAGSANGTVWELAQFGNTLCKEDENPVLFDSKDGINHLLSTSYGANKEVAGIAHGFIEYQGEYDTFWHNGGTQNFASFFAVVPEEDYAIAIIANTDAGNGIKMVQELGFETVKAKEITLEQPEDKLPSTKIVEGRYRDFREVHHGISQLLYLIPSSIHVNAVNDTQISVDGSLYNQIKPYLYQSVDDGTKCTFVVKNNKVIKYSNIIDYIPVSLKDDMKRLLTYTILAFFAITIIINIIYLIILFVRSRIMKGKLDNKEGNHVAKWIGFSIVGYLVLGLNCYHIIQKFISWESFSTMRFNLLLNGCIGILILVLNVLVIKLLRKKNDKIEKVLGNCYALASIFTIVILGTWGIFNFMK